MEQSERDAIQAYKEYFAKKFGVVQTINQLWLPDFDKNTYPKYTETLTALEQYLGRATPFAKALTRAAALRQNHYEQFILSKGLTEDKGHEHFREALNQTAEDATEKVAYWMEKRDALLDKKIAQFEQRPLSSVKYVAGIENPDVEDTKVKELPSEKRVQRPKMSAKERKRRRNFAKKLRQKQENALISKAEQESKQTKQKAISSQPGQQPKALAIAKETALKSTVDIIKDIENANQTSTNLPRSYFDLYGTVPLEYPHVELRMVAKSLLRPFRGMDELVSNDFTEGRMDQIRYFMKSTTKVYSVEDTSFVVFELFDAIYQSKRQKIYVDSSFEYLIAAVLGKFKDAKKLASALLNSGQKKDMTYDAVYFLRYWHISRYLDRIYELIELWNVISKVDQKTGVAIIQKEGVIELFSQPKSYLKSALPVRLLEVSRSYIAEYTDLRDEILNTLDLNVKKLNIKSCLHCNASANYRLENTGQTFCSTKCHLTNTFLNKPKYQ